MRLYAPFIVLAAWAALAAVGVQGSAAALVGLAATAAALCVSAHANRRRRGGRLG